MAVKTNANSSATKSWTYLVEKAPSELHVDLAAYILEETGLAPEDVSPEKWCQLVVAMHATWQKTDRVARRRRTVESIAKGGATTAIARGWAPDDLAAPVAVEVQAPAEEAPVEEAPKPAPKRRRAAAKKPEAPVAE